MKILAHLVSLVPGIVLSGGVAIAATLAERLEVLAFGQRWIESLVLAILLGMFICSWLPLSTRFKPGIHFSAKMLLEIAIVMLGASISFGVIRNLGPGLVAGIVIVVAATLPASYLIGRVFGLPRKLATLVACGNSICGNSAIAAAAPVIDADSDDVAAAIAFTAILGVAVVLALPFAKALLGMNAIPYGVLAGLTVYAVPQVLAATASAGVASVHIGTFVKLIRVLMLGPVVFMLGLMRRGTPQPRISLHHMVPWFIVGFLAMMVLRSFALIPEAIVSEMAVTSGYFTVVAMAALGLTVDVRTIMHASGRVIATASLSILLLAVFSLILIAILNIT